MKNRKLFQKVGAIGLLFAAILPAYGQKPAAPKQEKLLNGAKLLMWPDPSAGNVEVRVRIHSGTSFDPQGKEGVMALLADSFFPNETSADFFKDDLGGSLTVTANYDYIQIDASARPDEFLTMLEAVATAVSNPTIDKEATPKLVARRLEKLKELEKDAGYVADAAVAKRLFGTFPYGRPELGTVESVRKLTFADVLDAKQRFLTSDNATISISGQIDPTLTYRAARRYFGSWMKSDKLIPSTFKQPDAPDTKLASFTSDAAGDPQVRYALRGLARNDKDYAASQVLNFILENRLKENGVVNPTVRHMAHILPGSIVFRFSPPSGTEVPGNLATLLLAKAITNEEFTAAKARVSSVLKEIPVENIWMNVDTYKLTSATDDLNAFNAVTLADVQRVAERLAKNPIVAVAVNRAEKPSTSN